MELRDIVDQARAGDTTAFDRLIDGCRDMAMGYARSLVRHEQTAEDAVQEALIIAHRNLDQLLDSAAFVAWLHGIVRRRCLHNAKRHAAVSWVDVDEICGVGDLERRIVDRLVSGPVATAVANLGDDQRRVLRLHYEEGLSHAQIGALLGISRETVNMRLHAVRARLRRRLISMNEHESISGIGHVVSAEGSLITIQFPPDARPLVFARLVSDGAHLCVVRGLPDGQVQAVAAAQGGIWTPGRGVTDTCEPFVEALPNSIIAGIVSRTEHGAAFFPTGIKTIDMFAPMARGGSTGIFAEWGVGSLVLIPELVRRLDLPANRHTVFGFIPPMRDETEWRAVNAEITLGSRKMEVFYLPVEDPIARSFVEGMDALDTKLVLSRRLAEQGIWPSIDPLRSASRVLDPSREDVAEEVRALIRRYYTLQFSSEADRTLNQEEWTAVRRARLATRFLSQPFFVAETYTGAVGINAEVDEVAQTFAGILSGRFDDSQKEAFTMTGSSPRVG